MKMLSRFISSLALVSFSLQLFAAKPPYGEPQQAPNILFIAIDDLRCELGCYGSKIAKSPNIDALAATGVRFDRAYCQQAICGPSRASVMTGLRPDATQVHGNHTHFRDIHPDIVTLPQLFKNHGYHSRSMGKIYHGVFPEGSSRTVADTFGDPKSWSIPTFRPGPRYYYTEEGIEAAKGVYEKIYKPKNPSADDWTKKLVFGPATEAPDVADNVLYDGQVADHAVKSLIELADSDKPFFLAVGFIKPHSPYIAPKKYWDLYDTNSIPLADQATLKTEGIPSISMHGSGELRRYTDQQKKGPILEADQRKVRHAYLACISYIDAQIGRVLAELDSQSLAENTIVVLWSDHGYHLGERGLWGKTTNFELDTRVPLIIRAPEKSSGDCDAIVELVDIYPTLADLVGVPPRAWDQQQGESLVPLLEEPNLAWKNRAFSQFTKGKMRGYSVRTDKHRYTEWVDLKTGEVKERVIVDHSKNESASDVADKSPDATLEERDRFSRILNRGEGWRKAHQSELILDPVFTDNMVLQRHQSIPIWGTAPPASVIEVTFSGQQKETTADSNGRWSIEITALDPTERPQELFIRQGDDLIIRQNILIGDVWICSGQSNMRWMLKQTADAKNSIASSKNPNLRIQNLVSTIHPGSGKFPLLQLRNTFSDNLYKSEGWQVATPDSVPDFSGVAYHFGKMLQAETGVPIGLICNAVGGSPMEAWIPNDTADPNWLENSDLPKWVAGRAKLNLTKWTENQTAPTPHHPFEPGFLFEAGIRPFEKMPIRGVIWYQGESNATEDGAGSPPIDSKKNFLTHKKLIESWRTEFEDDDLPFYFVQLPGLNREWAAFREVQSKIDTLVPNTHMAITFDVGHPTNVHPTTKKPIGERLAKLALKHEYRNDFVAEAPRLTGWQLGEKSGALTFDRPVKLSTDAEISVAGKDRMFKKVLITQNEPTGLVCRTDPVGSKIEAIRYAWENDPKATITCAETGLPVAPFRTDDWPLVLPAKPPVAEEKIEGVGTGFENVKAGEISGDLISDGITLSATPGHAKISDTHPWKGKHGLHLLSGENRELTIRFPKTVKSGKVLAFQAERWTSRAPFEFKVYARNAASEEWPKIFDGAGKVVVGRAFLSSVAIPLKADFSELKLTATTPKGSGVLIDHLRILDKMPPGLVAIEPEHRVKLRTLGQDGVNSTRIPGLATTNAGTLIAVYDNRNRRGGDLPGDIDVGMNRSTDGGTTWEPMRVIMDMGDDSKWSYDGIGDPAVLVDRETGTIWVAATWSHGERSWRGSGPGLEPDETGQLMLTKSDDDGKTWSEPINITKQVKDPNWRFVLQGPGNGITMKDGTLVFPAQFRGENEEPVNGKPFSTLIYSKDRGATWKIGTGVKIDTTEAQLVELADGSIMINCRDNRGGSRAIYTTKDLGATWQEHSTSRSALPEPVCMASLIRVETEKYGPLLFFSNPAQTKGRAKMTIKVSNDEGLTWPEKWHTLVDAGPSAYSCMTAIGDDKIGLVYETPGELVFVRYSIEALLNQK